MFNNIGSKIKTLAMVICSLGIILSLLIGFIILVDGDESSGIGLIIMIGGSLSSWIGSLFAYGFGELIEKVTEIAENTKNNKSPSISADEKSELLETGETQEHIDGKESLENNKL